MRALLQCLTVIVVLVVVSCDEEASEIGSNFFEGGSLNMSTVDTITLKVATVKIDSVVTSDATHYLVGYHEDEDLGVISSASFFQIGPTDALSIDRDFTSYTRAELQLISDGYSFYDTLQSLTFNVYKVTDNIDFTEGDSYFYNTTTFRYDPTPMGTVTFKPRPHMGDTIKVPLSDAFGRDILRLAQASATEISNVGDFITYFHGLAIVPVSVDGPIVGFNTASQVRIYYSDKSQTPNVERYLALTSGSNFQFNRISTNRNGTKLSALKEQRYSVSSNDSDHKGYIQGGAGLALRVSIPYLRSILIDNPGLTVVNAVLSISPSRDNEDSNISLPTPLSMTSIDYQNNPIANYTETAVLFEDYYLERDTHYEVDITSFVKSQLATEEFNDNALMFTPEDATFRSTVDRVYFGDQLNERAMKLTLTCLRYTK